MKKLLLVDYYGICDEEGKPIGHSPKVLREYCDLAEDKYIVGAALSPCLVNTAGDGFGNVFKLKYDIRGYGRKGLPERIADKLKLFYNIHQVLKIKDYDIIWFYRTDFFLFFYFSLIKKRNKKIIGLVYHEAFGRGTLGGILNYLYRKGALKFDGLIYTQKGMADFHPNTIYIPDYYYSREKYQKYEQAEKKEKVVCPGTMTPYKKLEETVDAFNDNGIELEIKGHFYNKGRFHNLLKTKKENIVIEDVILSDEEYYRMIAEAKYCILPYDMEQYVNRTSGILQECVFLNTAPIAPAKLLNENGIYGIGYEDISDLGTKWAEMTSIEVDNSKVLREYDRANIQKRLVRFLEQSNMPEGLM